MGELSRASEKVSSATIGLTELLAISNLDALIVCVCNDLCPQVIDAAGSTQILTLFEKPGAVRPSDLKKVADRAAEHSVTIGAMYLHR